VQAAALADVKAGMDRVELPGADAPNDRDV
jgi:hypothetical protein